MQFYVTRFNWVNEPIRVFIFRRFEDEKNGAKSWERRSESFWLRFSGFHRKFRHRDDFFFFFGFQGLHLWHTKKKIVKKRESFRRRPQRRPLQPFEFQTVPDCSRLFQAVPGRLCSRKELCCSWCASPASTSSTTTVTTTTFCFLDLKKKQSAKKIDAVFSLNEFRFGQKEKKTKKTSFFFASRVQCTWSRFFGNVDL